MKRYGNLWPKIVSVDNISLAFNKAKKNKTFQKSVRDSLEHRESIIHSIHTSLVEGTYKTSEYRLKEIFEPKKRTIYVLPFNPDRIVQHALLNVLESLWESIFISDSYACRKGRGPHKGSKRCMEFVRRYKYCLKCDVSKFYPSIHHETLKGIICKKIKDARVLNLLYGIIDSIEGDVNVPIGNVLSQWFGNLYLNELDMFVKHKLRVEGYLRYCDDFCLFSNSKKELHCYLKQIEDLLNNELRLKLSKKDVFCTAQGVDFLGYRHFTDYLLLRKSTAKRMFKTLKSLIPRVEKGKLSWLQAQSVVASIEGWISFANTYNLSKAARITEIKAEIKRRREESA